MVRRFVVLLMLLIMLPLATGCLQVLVVPLVAVGAVVADRKICQKKGLPPPAVNPTLAALVENANTGEASKDAKAPAKEGDGAKPDK